MQKHLPLAIAYDFDGTLAPGNMQERDFIPKIGMTTSEFWAEVKQLAKAEEADNILAYMRLMIEKANAAKVPARKSDFVNFGRGLNFFEGVEAYRGPEGVTINGWIERLNYYAKTTGVRSEHYVISSGIREMVEGSRIFRYFKKVYASSFLYDHNDVAVWPALALNYTTKTQYLFRINKDSLHVYDHEQINKFIPPQDRPVPFSNIIFIGDGETDIPCFRLVKEQGGHAIAVYAPGKRGARAKSEALLSQGRVQFVCPADFREGSKLDKVVKAVIDKIAVDAHLARLAG